MKDNLKLLIRMLLIGLILSSCVVEATEAVPTGITGIAETELSGEYETLQAIITEQAATLESLSTPESPAQMEDDTGEFTVIEKEGFILKVPNQVANDIVVSNVLADNPEEGWPELALPARRVIGFEEYSILNHFHKPQIYVIPIQKMIEDGQHGGTVAINLQALLADPNFDLRQEGNLPFLPPFNAAQVFHVLEKRLDSDHNSGIRFLTLFSQGIVGVTNYEIFYTYQGISADGRYYIAAVLPVKSSLLSDTLLSNEDLDKIVDEYQDYIEGMTDLIRAENGGVVTPSLESLDAMMVSLVIQN